MRTIVRSAIVTLLLIAAALATPAAQNSIISKTSQGWLVGAASDQASVLLGADGVGYLKVAPGGAISLVNGGSIASWAATRFLGGDGTALVPTFSWQNDTDTGLYLGGANQINISIGGSNAGFLSAGNFTFPSTIYIGTGQDTQFSRESADYLLMRRGATAQRFGITNTYVSSVNKEEFSVDWQTTANNALVGTRTAATGNTRVIALVAQAANAADSYSMLRLTQTGAPFATLGLSAAAGTFTGSTSGTGNMFQFATYTNTATSGTVVSAAITPTYNQAAATTANTDLLINRTETAVGSGTQSLIEGQVGGSFRFRVTNAGQVRALNGFAVESSASYAMTAVVMTRTAPTIGSGFGTSPTVPASNGTAAFTINVGTGGTASSGVITMPTATTGWNCHVENRTAVAANRANQRTVQTATTTTSVTVQNQTISTGAALAWTASDILALACLGY